MSTITNRLHLPTTQTFSQLSTSIRAAAEKSADSAGSELIVQRAHEEPQSFNLADQATLSKLKDAQATRGTQVLMSVALSNGESVLINLASLNRDKLLETLDKTAQGLSPELRDDFIRKASPIIQNIRANYPAEADLKNVLRQQTALTL